MSTSIGNCGPRASPTSRWRAAGAPPGYAGLAISVLAQRSGVRKRGVGIVVAIVILCGFLFTRQLVSIIPTFLNAGLIIFLGVDLIKEWVIDTYRRYGRAEWLVVLDHPGDRGVFRLPGGHRRRSRHRRLPLCLFLRLGSGHPQFDDAFAAAQHRRTETASRSVAIGERGDAVEIMQLQGFLFFGTADQVQSRLQTRVLNPSARSCAC